MEHFQLCFKIDSWFHTQTVHVKTELCLLKFLVYMREGTPTSDIIYFSLYAGLKFGLNTSSAFFVARGCNKRDCYFTSMTSLNPGYHVAGICSIDLYIPFSWICSVQRNMLAIMKSPPKGQRHFKSLGISSSQHWDPGLEQLPLQVPSHLGYSVPGKTLHGHEVLC